MINSFEIFAPAKINLSLNVLSKRSDGYHEISSVMQAIELFDTVTVSVSKNDVENKIVVKTSNINLTSGKDNIAYKAANLMLTRFASFINASQTIEIYLEKKIPMAAGLAGGSADGAAVMLALAELWNLDISIEELALLGGEIGADVSFCVYSCAITNANINLMGKENTSPVALATGIGEKLSPIKSSVEAWILLVKPKIEVSTPKVYGAVKEYGSDDNTEALLDALQVNDFDKVTSNMNNDLEKVTTAEYPIVADTIGKMKKYCNQAKVMMSGSGPTVFAYFGNEDYAKECYYLVNEKLSDMEIFLVKAC